MTVKVVPWDAIQNFQIWITLALRNYELILFFTGKNKLLSLQFALDSNLVIQFIKKKKVHLSLQNCKHNIFLFLFERVNISS